MAGSWEIQQQNQVLTVILTREHVTTAWSAGFRNLMIPGTYTFLSGMPFDHARNTGCLKTLELGFDWCFFLDDDVIPPPDAILRLMSHKQPIVSGLYYRRNPPILPVMLKETPQGRQWIQEFPAPAVIEVDYVGAGCLLIHRDVLANFPPLSERCRWFEWRVDATDLAPDDVMSEDFAFCKQARKAGYKVLMDTGVQCRHAGGGESRVGGQFLPLELIA